MRNLREPRNARTEGECRVVLLPGEVTWDVLRPILDEIAASARPTLWVLSFLHTQHIRFQALRRFVRRVRQLGPLPRPIVLAGLNPYCEQILQFALIPVDWDLFLEVTGDIDLVAPRGYGAAGDTADGAGQPREDAPAFAFSRPCPN